ncbi:uncharacterized protein LOC144463914 [Epinephelus lanceolatus]
MDRNLRGGVRVRGGRGGRGGQRRQRTVISDEIRATVIDHVLVHGMSMREAGQRVQPNISRFTVSTIIRRFREENRIERLPHGGGRTGMFSPHQETLIVDMVRENNTIKLREIQQKIIEDHVNFEGINSVSLSTVDRVLKCNRLRMKQVHRVPFERNSDRVKEQRFQYVQRVFQLDAMERPHEYIYMDEARFNLTKRRRRGRSVIGQRAIVGVPGQRGGNFTLCAAISNHGVVHHHANLGPYNTHQLLIFLNHMRDALLGQQDEHPIYVVVWDNVSFHRAFQVREWFSMNQGFINLCLPPYSPFLNPIEEFFSSWRWKMMVEEVCLPTLTTPGGESGMSRIHMHSEVFNPSSLSFVTNL